MIYLIGGPPRCGKTTLAKKLSKKLSVTWISGDTMEGVVGPYVSKEHYPKVFPKNIIRDKTQNSNDLMYTQYTVEQIINAYIKQGEAPQYAIEVIIDNMLLSKQDFIIEGYHITPGFANSMQTKYGADNIKTVFLIKTDVNDALLTISTRYDKEDWVHNKTQDKKILKTIALFISEYSKYYLDGCKKYHIKYFDYQGGFNDHLEAAARFLTKT